LDRAGSKISGNGSLIKAYMSKKYEHLLMPEGDYPSEVAQNLAKMDDLCSQYEAVENKNDILAPLHSAYWQVLINTIPAFITEKSKERFSLPENFTGWVNFGMVSPDICPDCVELTALNDVIPEENQHIYDEYKVVYFDTWLQLMHTRNINYDQKIRLARRLQKAQDDLDGYPDRLASAFQQRKDFLQEYPLVKEVVKVSEEIDSRLPEYNAIKEKIELSQRISTEERIKYVKLTEELSHLREMRAREQQAISDKVPQNEMMRVDREIETTILLKGLLEKELHNAQGAVAEDVEWRKSLTIPTCREMLKEELRRTRTLIELAARRSHIKPLSLLIEKDPVPSPKMIVDAIEDILEVDPTLLAKGSRRREKFPTLLVVPIYGDGIYDFEKNVLLIPTRSPKGLTQAVATALIEYHLESESGNKFKESYLKLRQNEGIHSSIKLRERMLRDYISWVTLEAKGYQVLDQKTKQWFIENVAPTMFALKHQRRLGAFTIPEGNELIKHYELKTPDSVKQYEEELQVGLAYWKIGQYQQANQAFINAFNLEPQSQDACYNAALSCFKIGIKQKAIEYWRAYLRLDKMSFWTVRVQKFLNTVR